MIKLNNQNGVLHNQVNFNQVHYYHLQEMNNDNKYGSEDEFDEQRHKISRDVWNNIYCQYITKQDIQFLYKEIFDEHTRLRLFYDLIIAGMFC